MKDLGVLFDEKLRFDIHVRSTITHASKLLGFICRSLKPSEKLQTHIVLYNISCSKYSGIRLYNLQSILSHVHQYYWKCSTKYTRILCYKFKIPYNGYEDRLRKLNMTAPFYRRLYFDELLLYKIVSYKLTHESQLIVYFSHSK